MATIQITSIETIILINALKNLESDFHKLSLTDSHKYEQTLKDVQSLRWKIEEQTNY